MLTRARPRDAEVLLSDDGSSTTISTTEVSFNVYLTPTGRTMLAMSDFDCLVSDDDA
jgi:hypothetical protein